MNFHLSYPCWSLGCTGFVWWHRFMESIVTFIYLTYLQASHYGSSATTATPPYVALVPTSNIENTRLAVWKTPLSDLPTSCTKSSLCLSLRLVCVCSFTWGRILFFQLRQLLTKLKVAGFWLTINWSLTHHGPVTFSSAKILAKLKEENTALGVWLGLTFTFSPAAFWLQRLSILNQQAKMRLDQGYIL